MLILLIIKSTVMAAFKYKTEIENFISLGIALPMLDEPNDKVAYRYIFKDNPQKNHIPAFIKKPQRALTEIENSNPSTSGYALSCYEREDKAKEQFAKLEANFKKIRKSIGDSLSSGTLTNADGLISIADASSTHFDLYEFCECDLNRTFKLQCAL